MISRWERTILIISIPHAAAYGAFLGKFEISKPDASGGASLVALFAMLPLTAWWLSIVHDMLRSQLLIAGHMGGWLKTKHSFRSMISLLFPIAVAALKEWTDEGIFGLIGITLLTWWGAAWFVSTVYYLQLMRVLGVNLDD